MVLFHKKSYSDRTEGAFSVSHTLMTAVNISSSSNYVKGREGVKVFHSFHKQSYSHSSSGRTSNSYYNYGIGGSPIEINGEIFFEDSIYRQNRSHMISSYSAFGPHPCDSLMSRAGKGSEMKFICDLKVELNPENNFVFIDI